MRTNSRIALCRFAAENLLSETAALKDRVVNGADSLAAARIALGLRGNHHDRPRASSNDPDAYPGVQVIRFNRPEKKNAITRAMYAQDDRMR